jgi:hypothetical protein
LRHLKQGENVWIRDGKIWTAGKVICPGKYPRSYEIKKGNGLVVRRNRRDLRPAAMEYDEDTGMEEQDLVEVQGRSPEKESGELTRSKYGREIRPPIRYGFS